MSTHIDSSYHLAHHFEDPEQQREAHTLGLWFFLCTEVMFFGGLFGAYTVYRYMFHPAFVEAVEHLNVKFGAINTVILICSSLTMALGVYNAQKGNKKWLILWVVATFILSCGFLGVKSIEWTEKFHHHLIPGPTFGTYAEATFTDPHRSMMFYILYFFMTGLHGIHVIVGMGIMLWILKRAMNDEFNQHWYTPVELTGLYWHFVDVVWIFLFPLLYLLDRIHHHV